MWDVTGKPKQNDLFGQLDALDVLTEYDGPRTFTLNDSDGGLCLAHWLDEVQDVQRFAVVAVTQRLIDQLLRGELTVREVLDQPRVYVVDQENAGKVRAVWVTRLADIPQDVLPLPGIMLYRNLQPLLSLRAIGAAIRPGEIPGSVIKGTVEGAQKAIKCLAEFEMDAPARKGRPSLALRKLYDLPAQKLLAASFEVQFRSPLSEPNLFAGLAETEFHEAADVLARVGEHLKAGLDWLTSTGTDASALPVPGEPDLSRVIMKALKLLTPSPQGPVKELEIRGDLIARPTTPIRLTHKSRAIVNGALSRLPTNLQESRVQLVGSVRELNADTMSFLLRDLSSDSARNRECRFEPELWESFHDLLGNDSRVEIFGKETSPTSFVQVIDLLLRNE